ncbi:hypothetical protein DPMN_072989 [Dreissena polymorpha]|uniref:Uncharacterized protein n=1 Tax=Dreissena polymorpha TaxID=45954 RepID=A0A9D4HCJ4_DREPO|nr:hypothetical protein DPMN_072989 [Dreissena polymorpha]
MISKARYCSRQIVLGGDRCICRQCPIFVSVFAAAGHFNYLRSAYYYLQQMSSIEETPQDVYRKFIDRVHVVCRSNQCCAGLQ